MLGAALFADVQPTVCGSSLILLGDETHFRQTLEAGKEAKCAVLPPVC